jgi:hypothetical protein
MSDQWTVQWTMEELQKVKRRTKNCSKSKPSCISSVECDSSELANSESKKSRLAVSVNSSPNRTKKHHREVIVDTNFLSSNDTTERETEWYQNSDNDIFPSENECESCKSVNDSTNELDFDYWGICQQVEKQHRTPTYDWSDHRRGKLIMNARILCDIVGIE